MQRENKQPDAENCVIPCSESTKTALKKNTMLHIVRLAFLLVAALWISGYPRTVWQLGLIVLFGLCALIELYQIFYCQLSLRTSIVLSPDSAALKRSGTVTKTLRWDELAYVGRTSVRLSSISRKPHPYIVLSKYSPERVDDAGEAVRVQAKETILVEDTDENWELIRRYCRADRA